MILDTFSTLAWDAALDQNQGTHSIGDQLDLLHARDIANGQTLYVLFSFTTSVAGTDTTSVFQVVSHTVSTIPTDGTVAAIHLVTPTLTLADQAAGRRYIYTLPLLGPEYRRYLGLRRVVAGANSTAGAVRVSLMLDPAGWRAYPERQS